MSPTYRGEVHTQESDEFYAATVDRLTGQLYAMTGDLPEAQDVVQEAFVRAWQRRRALRQIPEAQRVAIVLHHLCDMSVDQVAVETGVPVGTVKARLTRGRAALAPFVNDTEISEDSRA